MSAQNSIPPQTSKSAISQLVPSDLAFKLGLEGIVSKRKDSAYRSGRSPDWLKMKNANAPAVKREEEEEWGKKKRR
jgi:ATP-dependent DNA ligase